MIMTAGLEKGKFLRKMSTAKLRNFGIQFFGLDKYIFKIIIIFAFVNYSTICHFWPWHYFSAIHIYITGHYSPSVRITAKLLTPLMLCVLILFVSVGTHSLTSTLKDKFLRNIFIAGLFTLKVFSRNLLRG